MNHDASIAPPAPTRPPVPTSSSLAPPLSGPEVSTRQSPGAAAPPLAMVLDELVGMVGDVRGALLASVDGFAIARSSGMPNSASHAAMLAAAMGLAHQLVKMGGGTELRQLVVDHDGGLLLLWPIGTGRVLALVTGRDVDQGSMRRCVQARVHWLAAVVA